MIWWAVVALLVGAGVGFTAGGLLWSVGAREIAGRLKTHRLRIVAASGRVLDVALDDLLLMATWAGEDGRLELLSLEDYTGKVRVFLDEIPEEVS